jgi:hypothetical protein
MHGVRTLGGPFGTRRLLFNLPTDEWMNRGGKVYWQYGHSIRSLGIPSGYRQREHSVRLHIDVFSRVSGIPSRSLKDDGGITEHSTLL